MKKLVVVIVSSLFICLALFASSDFEVINIARYTIRDGNGISSNEVITAVKYQDIDFTENSENIKNQTLTAANKIFLKADLMVWGTTDRNFYFRSTFSNSMYANKIKFTVIDLSTGEVVELGNNESNHFESSSFLFKGNRKYMIFLEAEDIKNTINLESALFSLQLVKKEDNAVLGSVTNKLLIKNDLKLKVAPENDSEQEFDKNEDLSVLGTLKLDNLLKEDIYFTVDLDKNVDFSTVELYIDGEKIKLIYDEVLKKYKTEDLNYDGEKKVELYIRGAKHIGAIEKGSIALEVNYNGKKYDEIRNSVIYKKDQNILIEKISKTASASIGDLVKYEVIIKNDLDEQFYEIEFIDILPKGMDFIENSVKVPENFVLEKVEKRSGNEIHIKLKVKNKTKSLESEKLVYMARVNVNAKDGKNVNRVTMVGKTNLEQVFTSNIATAEVKIDKDNFYDKGIVIGKVYLDLDDDGLFDEEKDIPVSGVKIFLENGDFAISDRFGKYSIYGVEALTHVAKVYRNTLPLGTKTKKISNLHSENGESRFIDLKKAELGKADFALTLDGSRDLEFVKKILEKRYEVLAQKNYELDRAIERKFLEQKKLGSRNELSGERGVIDSAQELDIESIRSMVLYENLTVEEKEAEEKKTLVEEWNLIPDHRLEAALYTFNNDLDIINVEDKRLVPAFMSFQVKGPGEGTLKLFTNDVEVSPANVTLTAKVAETNVFFLEYSSVKLDPGKTVLRLSYHDMFGVERGRIEKEVFVKGQYDDVKVEIVDSSEDSTLKKIKITGIDQYGYGIDQSLTVTIDANKGRFISYDGVTESSVTFVTNLDGYGEIGYRPNPGKNRVTFKINAEGKEKEISLDIEGDEQGFFLNGVIEGRYNFSKNRDMNFFFEKEIDSYRDKFFYRGAVYAEGQIEDIGYLTLTYDTNKDSEDKFFSYRDPEEYYPIFGDNSTKGYVGKSKDNLFLKMERDQSYLLYGDYKTGEILNQRLRLGRYDRTLTGAVVKYEDENILATGFIAETSNIKYQEEFRGEGVSGPYKLTRRDIVEGSEKVVLIVRDKISGLILEEENLVLGDDYTLEYDFGRLYFSEPIPSMDLSFNPIYIKVSYEVEDDNGKKSLVYGGEVNYKLNDKMIVGTSVFKDERETEKQEIMNLHAIYETEDTLVVVEQSFTTDELSERGNATSIFAQYEKENLKAEAIYERADPEYNNEDANVEDGINRAKINIEYGFEEKGKMKIESSLEERELESGSKERKIDTYLGYESEWMKNFKYEAGLRQYIKENITELETTYSLGGRITWKGMEDDKLKLFLEYEQGIENPDQKRIAIGADYKLFDKTSVYMRHELVSELSDFYYLEGEEEGNRTVFGVKTNYLETEIYSEYREENDDESVIPEFAYGLKRKFNLMENLEIFGTFERVSALSSEENSETNLTVGYDYEDINFGRMRGEFEFEIEDKSSFLNKLSYGKQFSKSTYFIAKNRYYIEGDEEENRFLIGLAYRDAKDNSYHSLNKYEFNYSKNIVDENYKKYTHIIRSAHNFQSKINSEKNITLAAKSSNIKYDGTESSYRSYLLAGGISYDLFDNWTAGINLATLFDSEKNIDYGLGFELGYIFKSNLWLSLGYNFVGFRDKDFDPNGELAQGLFLRFRMNIGDMFDRFKENGKKEPPEKVEIVDVYNLPKEK